MFPTKPKDYREISLNEFSDDDSSDDDDHRANDPSLTRQRQQELLKEQDLGLEMLGQSAERLGQLSMQISDEIHQQNNILEEMDTSLTEANDNLDLVTKKTKELVDQAGGTKNCLIIASLSVVIVILIMLILYT